MKFFYVAGLAITTTTTASLHAVHGASNFHLRRHLGEKGESSEDKFYGLIMSDDYDNEDANERACIQVRDDNPRKNQRLILGNCKGYKAGFRFDGDGLIHTELDDDWCISAGKRGAIQDGEFARLRKCDPDSELQKFYYVDGGGIRPQSSTDYCMVWEGNHADVGKDFIIFTNCDAAEDRIDWGGDFPREDYDGAV